MSAPTRAAAVTAPASTQSICTLDRYPARPANDFIAITTSDVPTAIGMGSPPSRASAGTTRKPPPAPTRPVTRPTTRPSATTLPTGNDEGAAPGSTSLRPRSMATAVAIMIAAKPISSTDPGMKRASRPPP